MELTSEYFGLTEELMEYLARGDGMYSVSDSKENLLSVTSGIVRNECREIEMTQKEDEPAQFFADIHFVLNDERRGVVHVCFAPVKVMLLNFKAVKLQDGESLADKIEEIKENVKNDGPNINQDTTALWSRCLLNYASKGFGTHVPNFVDAMLGMTMVKVAWSQDRESGKLFNFGQDDVLIYQCQIAYSSEENSTGSIAFQVMPYEISFSS